MDCQLYDNDNMFWIIKYDQSEAMGFVSLEKRKNHYYIDNFYVAPIHRGLGVGKEVFEYLMKMIFDDEGYFKELNKLYKINNCFEIRLVTKNKIAKKLFEKHGFCVYAKNGKYYKMKIERELKSDKFNTKGKV